MITDYSFAALETAVQELIDNQSLDSLNGIKSELNKYFADSECANVIFTLNTDKIPFGMNVLPTIDGADVTDILYDAQPIRVKRYLFEIDSKILEYFLTAKELTSLILFEIGHVVNDAAPIDKVRIAIDTHLELNSTVLAFKESVHYKDLLAYGIKDTIRRITSLYYRSKGMLTDDLFIFNCGYAEEFASANDKLSTVMFANQEMYNKYIVLDWVLRVYEDMKHQKIIVMHTLRKCERFTASKLEIKELETAAIAVSKIDDFSIQEAANEVKTLSSKNNFFQQLQRGGLRGLEQDIYEYILRVRNIEEEDEALLLMRQINSRMAILDDYIATHPEDKEIDRWHEVYGKYEKLRTELAEKAVYNKKNYGLWYDYNGGSSSR